MDQNFDVKAEDIESVGSCDSDVRDESEAQFDSLTFDKIYLRSHAGICLQTVLQDMMTKGQINVVQKSDLEREFNRIYHSAFSQCHSKLHLNIHAKLNEFALVESGSFLKVEQCVINGPSSSVRVPKGDTRLVYANRL
jgi:hypothetical protein